MWQMLPMGRWARCPSWPDSGTLGAVGMAEDAELAEDLVGVTSARLLAAGIPRDERNGALRLLGVLATVADRDQRVRRPLREVAREFALAPDDVEVWAGHLQAVGALRRNGDHVVLLGAEPAYAGGLRLHDFLDAAAELDHPPARREVRDLVRPLSAVLVAAALLVAVLATPRLLNQKATPVSSERDRITTATPSTSTPTGSGVTGTTGATGNGGSSPATTAGAGGVAPVTPAAPTTTTLLPLPPCPTGLPGIDVPSTSTDLAGNLAVAGILRNPTDTPMIVQGFTVQATVLGQTVSVPGIAAPVSVAPHGSTSWQTSLGVVAAPGTPVTTVLGAWSWDDPSLPSSCGAP